MASAMQNIVGAAAIMPSSVQKPTTPTIPPTKNIA